MTSKEALKEFYDYVAADAIDKSKYLALGAEAIQKWPKRYYIIEKDLNRLEKLEKAIKLLKKLYPFEFNEGVVNYDCDDMCQSFYYYSIDEMSIEKDDYYLLKEVLENGI